MALCPLGGEGLEPRHEAGLVHAAGENLPEWQPLQLPVRSAQHDGKGLGGRADVDQPVSLLPEVERGRDKRLLNRLQDHLLGEEGGHQGIRAVVVPGSGAVNGGGGGGELEVLGDLRVPLKGEAERVKGGEIGEVAVLDRALGGGDVLGGGGGGGEARRAAGGDRRRGAESGVRGDRLSMDNLGNN